VAPGLALSSDGSEVNMLARNARAAASV